MGVAFESRLVWMGKSLRARVVAPEHGDLVGSHSARVLETPNMFKDPFVRFAVLPLALTALALQVSETVGAEPGPEAVRLERFTHPDGTNYFAVGLKPDAATPVAGPRDVLFLIDTSASQTGEYRKKGIEALRGALSNLGPGDRAMLMACDLSTAALTKSFVPPGSPEMAEALTKLDARVPLGSTDMQKALSAVVDGFAAGSQNPRAAIYIGDGMSAANLLGTEEFEALTKKLVEARIPVSSYAVGSRQDLQLLGALAGRTGGVVIDDGEQVGQKLAAAARATVLWPTSVTWLGGKAEIYPANPPLRSDRDTAIIGTFSGNGPFEIRMSVAGSGTAQDLSWSVQPGVSHDNNAYLAQLVGRAKVDGGISLPIVGSASLELARQAINVGMKTLAELARQALDSGNLDNAERLADAALERDPNDPEAWAVKTAVERRRQAGGGAVAGGPPIPLDGPGGGVVDLGGVGGDMELVGDEGTFAEAFVRERRVVEQMIQTEVQNAVNQARGQMRTDPEGATQNLMIMLENVKQAPDLNPEIRDQLVDMIQAARRAADRRRIEVERERQARYERQAATAERLRLLENLRRKQQKVANLMERFNSLMDEGRYKLAEETVAAAVLEEMPDSPVGVVATHTARATGYLHDAMVLRVLRQKATVDTLYQVEKSHIPFPDEPPIVYPPAEVWKELTARRKEKYSSMSLAQRGAKEKEIEDALKSPTQLEFIETQLQDVVDFLKEYHNIEIQIDTRALEQVGIPTDTPITKNLKGVSLRSALRLMLRELDLTYVIEDEVLLITTPEEAEQKLTTKVYPVADLVLPIDNSMMGGYGGFGGFGMGGGMGMMGAGRGGMMGIQGGLGGGLGGMGGFGGGMMGRGMGMGMGGFMNLPKDVVPRVPVNGFRAFSVKDDVPRPNKVLAKAEKSEKPEQIVVEIDDDDDPEVVWDEYFRTHDPSPAAVREAVRRLGNNKTNPKRFKHIIALIGASLRHQQSERPMYDSRQQWMYEVLAIAMQADDRPSAEIERVVMSAVDLANNSADLMHVGVYAARLGLHERALQIFQQVAEMEPVWPEPYMHGLKAAQRIQNDQGIQWAALGILSQAWTRDEGMVWKTGLYAAHAMLKKLRDEGRTSEAKEFETALNQALIRDCWVKVSYTGDADVDLLVEEPSGSVCSLRNPRTTGGGVLVGDISSRTGLDNAGIRSEVYVCPKAFSGDYRMLVRRVWGKVTNDQVTVEIHRHFRSKRPQVLRKRIPLKDDEALVKFDLQNGRRTEPLEQRQAEMAAVGQIAVGRQILAQQLAAAVDPQALSSLAMSRNDNNGGGFPWFARHGAVGYQPVIITLPEGANMMATAVISADRRYVRITSAPLFSGIAEVNVFNMATGTSTGGRGTGGQGYSGVFGPDAGGGGGGFGGGGGGIDPGFGGGGGIDPGFGGGGGIDPGFGGGGIDPGFGGGGGIDPGFGGGGGAFF